MIHNILRYDWIYSLFKQRHFYTPPHANNDFFPTLPLAYATTVHKAQGLTLDYVIVDFEKKSKRAVPAGSFYTAVTRVKSLDKLYFRNFETSHIRTDSRVKEEMTKQSQRPYIFLKRFLNETCFENNASETKISFMNINGFSLHRQDISTDRNLLRSDVIAFAETKSKAACDFFNIDGYECTSVLKAVNDQSGGMALLCKQEKKCDIKVIGKKHIEFESSYFQYIKITVNKQIFTFLYIHPTVSRKGQERLKEHMNSFQDSSGEINFKCFNHP